MRALEARFKQATLQQPINDRRTEERGTSDEKSRVAGCCFSIDRTVASLTSELAAVLVVCTVPILNASFQSVIITIWKAEESVVSIQNVVVCSPPPPRKITASENKPTRSEQLQ